MAALLLRLRSTPLFLARRWLLLRLLLPASLLLLGRLPPSLLLLGRLPPSLLRLGAHPVFTVPPEREYLTAMVLLALAPMLGVMFAELTLRVWVGA